MEIILTYKGKPSLILDGYRYRVCGQTQTYINWRCVKEKRIKCKGSLKTTLDYKEILESKHHDCIPNIAETEIVKAKYVCKKRIAEEMSTPVTTIYKEEFTELVNRGYEFVADVPKYESVKTSFCQERRRALGTMQNPENSAQISFNDEMTKLPDGTNFV